jgi:hypothetical protein
VTLTLGTGAELNTFYAIMLSWPIALTGIVAIAFRRRLRRPFAFICLGYLVCVGTLYLIGQTDAFGGWIHTAAATPTDKLLAIVINREIECMVAAIPLSILPLVWLCKLMLLRSPVGNPNLQAET